jgi:hypothetical protein
MSTLNQIRDLIQENNIIEEEKIGNIIIITLKDKKTKKEKAYINMVACNATVANYKTNNHWFTECDTMEVPSITVLSLTSEVKGMGKLILAYGVLTMKERHPDIKYSSLDDMSNKSIHMEDNIYSKFGYTPTAAVTKTNVANTIKLGGSEKQVLLDTFERKARAYLFPTQSRSPSQTRPSQKRQVRGRTLNRVATKTRSNALKRIRSRSRRSRSRGAENKG